MSYGDDRGEVNELYAAERDETRSARRALTDTERARNCGHSNRRRGMCPDCGDTEGRDSV